MSSLLRDRPPDELARLAVESYGAEVHGFLAHLLGCADSAERAFWEAIEDFWRELPGVRDRRSVRTWLYRFAYQASVRPRRAPDSRASSTGSSTLPQRIGAAHTLTASWRRLDPSDKWGELRRELALADRALLVLRVDRGLGWTEIAQVMLDDGAEDACDDAVSREAARLRGRFQRLKDQLRVRARAVGLR